MDLAAIEVDLLPLKGSHFSGTEAVAVGHQHHQRIAGAVAVAAGGLDQPLDFGIGQVLALAQLPVRRRPRRPRSDNCPVLVGGATSRRFDFAMSHVLPVFMTVLILPGNGTVMKGECFGW